MKKVVEPLPLCHSRSSPYIWFGYLELPLYSAWKTTVCTVTFISETIKRSNTIGCVSFHGSRDLHLLLPELKWSDLQSNRNNGLMKEQQESYIRAWMFFSQPHVQIDLQSLNSTPNATRAVPEERAFHYSVIVTAGVAYQSRWQIVPSAQQILWDFIFVGGREMTTALLGVIFWDGLRRDWRQGESHLHMELSWEKPFAAALLPW